MKAVNLIPADRPKSRRKPSRPSVSLNPYVLLALVVVIAVIGGIVVEVRSANSTISERRQTLGDVQTEIAKVPKPDVPLPGVISRLGVVTAVQGQRTSWDGFLSAVSRVMPEDVWLNSLSATAPSFTTGAAAPAPATNGFTVSGTTYSEPSVARLMRRLALVPWLSNVSLTSSTKSALADHIVYQFTLGAQVIPLPEVGS